MSTWQDWEFGEHKQLNQFPDLQMYKELIVKPTDKNAVILCPHQQYRVKQCGTRRARQCCDGSKRATPLLHALALTYSSCVEHPIQCLFLATSANLDLKIYGGDAKDVFAHSPLPSVPTFVTIDEQCADWYKFKFGRRIDQARVLPIMRALQGHPESGRLWEKHINNVLFSKELNFKTTTHDRTMIGLQQLLPLYHWI